MSNQRDFLEKQTVLRLKGKRTKGYNEKRYIRLSSCLLPYVSSFLKVQIRPRTKTEFLQSTNVRENRSARIRCDWTLRSRIKYFAKKSSTSAPRTEIRQCCSKRCALRRQRDLRDGDFDMEIACRGFRHLWSVKWSFSRQLRRRISGSSMLAEQVYGKSYLNEASLFQILFGDMIGERRQKYSIS